MIQVTAAIIHNDGKLLLCQKPKGKRCELLWEFPGGKIDHDETPEECLIRECSEELGVIIKTEQLVQEVEYEYPDINVNIHFFLCTLVEGEPKCIEHNDVRWFTLNDILKMPLCPADRKMFNQSFDKIKMYLATREI